MRRKSDTSGERRISATQASRSFSKLLDQIEAGGRFLIQRRVQDICLVAPPPVLGRRACDCLALLSGRSPVLLDDRFSKDLLEILTGEPLQEGSLWDS